MRKYSIVPVMLLTIAFNCLFIAPVTAQSWQWGKTNTGGGIDAWPIASDNSGNVYCAGISFQGDVTFGSTTITFPLGFALGDEQGIIVKYNNTGTVLWAKGFQTPTLGWSQPVSMTTDPAGNLIVLGIFNGTISMDAFSLTTIYSQQYFLMKISPAGTVLWLIASGEAGTFYGNFTTAGFVNHFVLTWGAVACDNTGNIFITGNYTGSTTIGATTLTSASVAGDNVFVAEYTSAGANVWATGFGGTGDDNAWGITVSSTGNVYLTGAFTSPSMTIGSTTLTNSFGIQDAFIAEYSSSGTALWSVAAGGANGAFGAGMTSDASGNVYITGSFGDPSITIGGTTINAVYPASGYLEVYLIQLNSSNAVTWSKVIGTPSYDMMGYCIALASCGQVWVSGSWAVVPFAGGILTDSANIDGNILHTPDSSIDPVFIAGYNLAGGVVSYGALMSGADDQNGIACDPTGNVFICADYWNQDFTGFVIGPDILYGDPLFNPAEFFYIGKFTNAITGPDTIKKVTDTALCTLAGFQLTAPAGYYAPYLWSNGDTTMSITIDSAGTYWLECPGSCNASYLFDTFHVSLNTLDTLHQSHDTGMCTGSSIVLQAPTGYLIYHWNTGITTAAITITTPGTYWVDCFDSCLRQPIVDTFHVFNSTIDTLHSLHDTAVCAGASIVLQAPSGYLSYTWNNGSTTAAVTNTGAGTFWVTCSDSCAMPPMVDTFHVSVNQRDTLYKTNDTTICTSSNLTFIAPAGYLNYQWSTGSTGTTISVPSSPSATYWVMCTDSCVMPALADTFKVNFKPLDLTFSLGNDTMACGEVILMIPDTGVTYLWQNGSTAQSYTVTMSGTYSAKVSEMGCSYSDSINVTITYKNLYNFDTIVCVDKQINVTLTADMSSGASVMWSNGSRAQSITVIDTGTFYAKISDSGCYTIDTMQVKGQYCNCWCWVPNAFTPNAHLNSTFKPIIDPLCVVHDYTFSIYDRWGALVYSTNDENAYWDGTYSGVPAELGVYMYQVTFHGGLLNKRFYFKGDVTLVR